MNNAYDIVRMLEHAGLHVNGADGEFIYIEDPGCVVRGFQNFLENAWIVLTFITVILIMLWGISMITGAKNDIKNNFKNIVLIFGILTASGPILNVIYGGDLIGATCGEIRVNMNDVNDMLASNVGANANTSLYEDIDIYDSGALPLPELAEPVVPDISALTDVDVPESGLEVSNQ